MFCSPFVFILQDFHQNQGSFVSLGARAALIKVLHLCLPVQGEVKASLPQSLSEGWEVWREHVSVAFPTQL